MNKDAVPHFSRKSLFAQPLERPIKEHNFFLARSDIVSQVFAHTPTCALKKCETQKKSVRNKFADWKLKRLSRQHCKKYFLRQYKNVELRLTGIQKFYAEGKNNFFVIAQHNNFNPWRRFECAGLGLFLW
ncbi:MAG: hypothetical protein GY696_35500 [Gammaproteobacteria bacterium]|nr:hypothetical protein [Gammaproteobacteria bacterium]